jgi:hypothetical protein
VLERLITPACFLDRVVGAIENGGLRNDPRAVLEMVVAAQVRGPDAAAMAAAAPSGFLAVNNVSRARLRTLLEPVVEGVVFQTSADLLVPMAAIETFSAAASIPSAQLAGIPFPLDALEDDVERALLRVVGEPFQQQDWGGELGDVYSPRVRMAGREIQTAMLLKGRGLGRRTMRLTDLGKNGDQVVRLTKLPATLYVVQYVGEIDEAVRTHLMQAIAFLRLRGQPDAVGSVWDGGDTARLLLAHGLLDPVSGHVLASPSGS